LNDHGFLDVIVQDDSMVDYVKLTLDYCCDGNNLTASCGGEYYPGDEVSVDVYASINTPNTYGTEVEMAADPNILQLGSAAFGDLFPLGVSLRYSLMDIGVGVWYGGASLMNPEPPFAIPVTGSFADVTYTALNPGVAILDLNDSLFSDRDGFELPGSVTACSVTVLPFGSVSGAVTYQGRLAHADIEVTAAGPVSNLALTHADGRFEIGELRAGDYDITADAPLYLPSCITTQVSSGQDLVLPDTRLSGGDANDDGVINIADATLLGANLNLSVPLPDARADINADGLVNVQDLAIVGGNYELAGCQPW
jgi:hypothetical protein